MKINLVLLDESRDWCEEIKVRVKDAKIYGVYIYRPDVRVHCCELTASYELWFVGSIFSPISEDDETIADEIETADQATLHDRAIIYVHCHEIDAIPTPKRLGKYSFQAARGRYRLGNFTEQEGYYADEHESVEEKVSQWCREAGVV